MNDPESKYILYSLIYSRGQQIIESEPPLRSSLGLLTNAIFENTRNACIDPTRKLLHFDENLLPKLKAFDETHGYPQRDTLSLKDMEKSLDRREKMSRAKQKKKSKNQ